MFYLLSCYSFTHIESIWFILSVANCLTIVMFFKKLEQNDSIFFLFFLSTFIPVCKQKVWNLILSYTSVLESLYLCSDPCKKDTELTMLLVVSNVHIVVMYLTNMCLVIHIRGKELAACIPNEKIFLLLTNLFITDA